MPASVLKAHLPQQELGLPEWAFRSSESRLATADFLWRLLQDAIKMYTCPNRGAEGSGSFQRSVVPQQVIARNCMQVTEEGIVTWIRISLPGQRSPKVMANALIAMLFDELPQLLQVLHDVANSPDDMQNHCEVVEDAEFLAHRLSDLGLVAFVPDGALLARASGVSDEPLRGSDLVPFKTPDTLAVDIDFPFAGRVRGMGIPNGVTVIVGGGYQGKSTLLNALSRSVYPHIPEDGRERMVLSRDAMFLQAEDGRAVRNVNISSFVRTLPGEKKTELFCTDNASGSTSQAAALVESLAAGAKILLFDEDSSATNFLIRDEIMRQVVPDDPLVPMLDRIRELYESHHVSSILVVGSSSGYLGVADRVICMRDYRAQDITDRVRSFSLPRPKSPSDPVVIEDSRRLKPTNFQPSYNASRQGKVISERIKTLRGQPRVLEYGNDQVALTALAALVDEGQVLAIGRALLAANHGLLASHGSVSPTDLSYLLETDFSHEKGLTKWAGSSYLFLTLPRRLEIAAAINRIRSLEVI